MSDVKGVFLIIILFICGCSNNINHIDDIIDDNSSDNMNNINNYPNVCIKNTCFNVEIVSKMEDRTRGLMQKEVLPENEGMLFVYQNSSNNIIWMYNMSFPLDILWIDDNKSIVHMVENAQPCTTESYLCDRYVSPTHSKYVFEINSGLINKLKIEVGDTLNFNNI